MTATEGEHAMDEFIKATATAHCWWYDVKPFPKIEGNGTQTDK